MVGRLGLGVATALSLLTTSGLYAQGMAPAPGSQAFTSSAFTSPAAYAPAAYGQPSAGPAPIVQGASPFGTPIVPAGYSQDPNAPMGDSGPGCPGGCNAYGSMPGCGGSSESGDDFDTPWDQLICRALRNADIRLSYINWGISRPATTLIGENPGPGVLQPKFGQVAIGSFNGQVIYVPAFFFGLFPTSVQKNPTDIFPILNTQGAQVGQARAYDTTGISLAENSGFKGTFSLPMTYGTIETNGFILGKANSAPNPGGLPQGIIGETESFAAIPVDIGGQPSNAVALFSQGFDQYFSSFVYGAETNVYFNAIVPKDYGLVLKPMVGFRYLGIDEHFNVIGLNPGVPATTIESSTINNIYGPSVGCRLELLTQWFSIGVDPRVTFAVNQFAANVNSSDPNTGDSHDHLIDARFAPVGALDAFIKIPIQEHCRLYAAYNLLGTTNISRPQSQIDYNVTTGGQNDTHLSLSSAGIMIQGYEVGCEFNF